MTRFYECFIIRFCSFCNSFNVNFVTCFHIFSARDGFFDGISFKSWHVVFDQYHSYGHHLTWFMTLVLQRLSLLMKSFLYFVMCDLWLVSPSVLIFLTMFRDGYFATGISYDDTLYGTLDDTLEGDRLWCACYHKRILLV